jgi:hypothetical protein
LNIDMAGHRSFDGLRGRMPPERCARNDAAITALLQELASERVHRSSQEVDGDHAQEAINSAASAK